MPNRQVGAYSTWLQRFPIRFRLSCDSDVWPSLILTRVKFAKLDVDAKPRSAISYGIRGIPTLLIFNGGKPVDPVVGAVPKSVLKRRLEEAAA